MMGRYHNLNGSVILLQKSTRNYLACLAYGIVKVVTFGAWPKSSGWTWIHSDYLNEANDMYKAMERLNELSDEYEKLTKFINAEDARIRDIKKLIESSPNETKGYSKRELFDITKYRYRTLDIKEPEHRWKRIFKNKGIESVGGLMNGRKMPKTNVDLAFTDKRSNEQYSFALNQIAKKEGADDLVPVEVNSIKPGSSSKQGKDGGNFHPGKLKGKKKISGESDASYERRKALIESGGEVAESWDIYQ